MPALILKERGIIHMKKSFALFLSLFLAFTLASAQAESYLLKLGTSLSDSDPITEGLMEFERIVEEQTQLRFIPVRSLVPTRTSLSNAQWAWALV